MRSKDWAWKLVTLVKGPVATGSGLGYLAGSEMADHTWSGAMSWLPSSCRATEQGRVKVRVTAVALLAVTESR